jgi:glycerate kinase
MTNAMGGKDGKTIVAFDSFKGCLTSVQANAAAALAVKHCESGHMDEAGHQVLQLAMSDGGEGMLEAVMSANGEGRYIERPTHDALMRPIRGRLGISDDGTIGYIELATASGLTGIEPSLRNPLHTSTFGTGELVRAALEAGCRHIVMGIGGSCTNDAATGLLRALGFRFLDAQGSDVAQGGEGLARIRTVDTTHVMPEVRESRFTLITDVTNPLCGPQGATHVFAPQKGATEAMVSQLEAGMRSFGRVMERATGRTIVSLPGAGAAGGTGAGMAAFVQAELVNGTDALLDAWHFDEEMADASLILTGEGHSDVQTLMGKVPYGILRRARMGHVPVALLSGGVTDREALLRAGFIAVEAITPVGMAMEEALRPAVAERNLQNAVGRLLHDLQKLH